MRNLFLGITTALLLASCAVKKKSISTQKHTDTATSREASKDLTTPVAILSIEDLNHSVQRQAYDYNSLSIKADANLMLPNLHQEITLNMRMQKGQKIWISATALLGIEVARVLITPEKIQIMNKLQNQYIEKPFSFVQQYVGDLDFQTLQDVFVGNIPSDFWSSKPKIDTQDLEKYTLSSVYQGYILQYVLNAAMRPQNFRVDASNKHSSCNVQYDTFNADKLPTSVQLDATTTQQKLALKLNYTFIQRNIPLEFPFNVPSKYKE